MIGCTNKHPIAKVVGKSIYLNDGSFITGQDFSLALKCNCGEVGSIYTDNGTIKYDQESEEGTGGQQNDSGHVPGTTDAPATGGGSTGGGSSDGSQLTGDEIEVDGKFIRGKA